LGYRLHATPHSILGGRRYTLELSSGPRFPEVPALPGFPSAPCRLSTTSAAYVCGTCPALSILPTSGTLTRFSRMTRSSGHFLPPSVSTSPNIALMGIGSKDGVAPSSARCSVASLTRSTTLRRAYRYWRTGFSDVCVLAGDWRPPLVLHAEGGGLFPVSHGRIDMRRKKVCDDDFTPGSLAGLPAGCRPRGWTLPPWLVCHDRHRPADGFAVQGTSCYQVSRIWIIYMPETLIECGKSLY